MATSCPRSSMQHSVLSRLNSVSSPSFGVFCSRDRNVQKYAHFTAHRTVRMVLGCGCQGKISSKGLCFPGCTCSDITMPMHTISKIFLYALQTVLDLIVGAIPKNC